ncbi:MAG: hypothetical protein Q7T33_06060 [Dehalococcoidia bacterium]|nr:hypothetical protein [Dehalococcoidia bacterium]
MAKRACSTANEDGDRCQAPPLHDGDFCLMHSPEHAEEVAEARRLGGLRRRREKTVAVAYDLEGLGTVDQIRRLIEIAALDALGLENSVARSRTLAYLAQVALKALEISDFADRVAALEAAIGPRLMRKR